MFEFFLFIIRRSRYPSIRSNKIKTVKKTVLPVEEYFHVVAGKNYSLSHAYFSNHFDCWGDTTQIPHECAWSLFLHTYTYIYICRRELPFFKALSYNVWIGLVRASLHPYIYI